MASDPTLLWEEIPDQWVDEFGDPIPDMEVDPAGYEAWLVEHDRKVKAGVPGDPNADQLNAELAAEAGGGGQVMAAAPGPFVGSIDGQPTKARAARVLARLARGRATVGAELLSGARVAYADAMRHAGVKVAARARSRKSAAKQREVQAAVEAGEPLAPFMPVVGITEAEVLAGAFDSYRHVSRAALTEWLAGRRDLLDRAGFDSRRFARAGDPAVASDYVVAGLLSIVRRSLVEGVTPQGFTAAVPRVKPKPPAALDLLKRPRGSGSDLPPPAFAPVASELPRGLAALKARERVPATMVLSAFGVAEGRSRVVFPASPDDQPTLVALEGEERLEDAIVEAVEGTKVYRWVHGFYGEPDSPFEPHLLLDGYETTTPWRDDALWNNEEWPEEDRYFPGDHAYCTCEWETLVE